MKTAILGAGVSGLSLARFLVEGGLPPGDVHLFEASSKVGGLCGSKTVDGFTYDVAGGHILFSKDRSAMQWMKDCSGGDEAFVKRDRHTKIRFGDRFVHYPFENGLGDLPPEANFDCLKGYIEAWQRRQVAKSEAPGDFASWIPWRFGEGIARHFMVPYNEKIWKVPLDSLSSGWVAGRVPDAPIDDVLRASVGLRTEGYTHQATFYYPKRGGFEAISNGFASTLTQQIRLATPVESVRRSGTGWLVNGEAFDRLVNTLPLDTLPDIFEGIPSDVVAAMRSFEFNSILCFLVALKRPEHPDLSWVYLPHPSQGPANRITYMSNYSPHNAPPGKTSLLCEVTLRSDEPVPGPEIERQVVSGLEQAGLLRRGEVLFTDRSYSRHAYIVFDLQFDARRASVLEWVHGAGFETHGRFGRYDYDNSDVCVIKSRALAQKLLRHAAAG